MKIERLLERFGLHDIGVICRAMSDRPDALGNAALVGVGNQLEPDFSRRAVSKRNHLLEFPSGIDVHQRKRDRSRVKCFLRQAKHHRGVFADRVQHHRLGGGSRDFANNFDRLRLQL